jgi:pSer/pThr/pTyr-binding forkhead associated (FHA) protein/DNA-binding CsgD family transcriptional regulator
VLEITVGDRRFDFTDDEVVTIGRAESNRVSIDDHRVSRSHLEVRCDRGYWRVVDVGSANGTFAAGRAVREIELRRPLDLSLADPDDGIALRLVPLGAVETVRVGTAQSSDSVLRIGRASDNDLVLDDTRSSRYHAELIPHGTGAEIRDCGSANGTRVNGALVDQQAVDVGDLIEIGDTTMRVVPGPHGPQLEIVARGATMLGDRPPSSKGAPLPGDDDVSVTPREREVLALVAGGASDKQIAAALFISVSSVRSHLDRIHGKTGRRKRADLTRLAYELGVVPTPAGELGA